MISTYAAMHLFQCVICERQMASQGRDQDGRCTFCAHSYRGLSDKEARRQEWHDRADTPKIATPPQELLKQLEEKFGPFNTRLVEYVWKAAKREI